MLCVPFALIAQVKESPQIKFESTIHDYGDIQELDGKVTTVFKFQNISNNPYIIRNISVGCGCTVPKYNKAPIMPGEKSEIHVVYDPENRPGDFYNSLFVVEGSGKYVNKITIKGHVVSRPQTIDDLYPISLENGVKLESLLATYNSIPVGYKHNLIIETYNSSSSDAILKTEIKGDDKRFIVYASPSTLKPRQKGQIFIIYNLSEEPKKYGRFGTEVMLSINGKPTNKPIIINGISIPDFTNYTPKMIQNAAVGEISNRFHSFGNIAVNELTTKTFTIKNLGVSDLEILSVSTDHNSISADVSKEIAKTGQEIILTINIAPKDRDKGRLSASIIVVTNDQSMPIKELRISANIR